MRQRTAHGSGSVTHHQYCRDCKHACSGRQWPLRARCLVFSRIEHCAACSVKATSKVLGSNSLRIYTCPAPIRNVTFKASYDTILSSD